MTYITFLRAINVAGHATVTMTALRRAFEDAGFRNVRTYIQSGNVIFDSPWRVETQVLSKVRRIVKAATGAEPHVFLRTVDEVKTLVKLDPFRNIVGPQVKFYVAFLSGEPTSKKRAPFVSSKEALELLAVKKREVFVVSRRKKNGFFGFPNNFVEDRLGVAATTRNWSTVTKIARLVDES